ncbi:Gfo/Idh/MocA family protein [Paractinoplanes durhamensis]|uniref:Gfo/Idh/MocA-like oxidoreductase N-terminal domain-containing protein n=1 Tax=Paractinoplanes durhamensis TaxID=113563 RepID=A0ABQ3YXR5_9ACTN|nr:Gfo/Idh/MocA family oxidoreductase [Actinoplanes durhamensis]GIE02347.1 hypothetical protein Adu01nite_36970 [Actinoplanes durhamensis]
MTVRLLLVGAGQRGTTYARRAEATGAGRVVAVVDPDPARRALFAVPGFADWTAIDSRIADAAIVATQDRDHEGPAVHLAGLGYHLLLEKPMAPVEESALRIAAAADDAGVMLAVCHVLRYTAYTNWLSLFFYQEKSGE